jgi:hypothetical protein
MVWMILVYPGFTVRFLRDYAIFLAKSALNLKLEHPSQLASLWRLGARVTVLDDD